MGRVQKDNKNTKNLIARYINNYRSKYHIGDSIYKDEGVWNLNYCETSIWDVLQEWKAEVPVQDGDLRKFWTHFSPKTHQIYSYIWNNFLWKKD